MLDAVQRWPVHAFVKMYFKASTNSSTCAVGTPTKLVERPNVAACAVHVATCLSATTMVVVGAMLLAAVRYFADSATMSSDAAQTCPSTMASFATICMKLMKTVAVLTNMSPTASTITWQANCSSRMKDKQLPSAHVTRTNSGCSERNGCDACPASQTVQSRIFYDDDNDDDYDDD